MNNVILANKDILVKSLLYPGLIVRITSLKGDHHLHKKKNYPWIKELCSRLTERVHFIIKKRRTFNLIILGKGVLEICSQFTGEQPCRSVISIKLLCNFFEITLRHECSPVNLLHIFRTPFYKNTSGKLFLYMYFGLHEDVLRPYLFLSLDQQSSHCISQNQIVQATSMVLSLER